MEQAFAEIFEVAIAMGGTITGEHGVGIVKAPYLEWKVGEAGIKMMKSIKDAIDPHQIMNPGKLFAETRKRIIYQDRTEAVGRTTTQDEEIQTP